MVDKPTQDNPVTLITVEAVNLWRKGREAWNQWVSKNPGANVNFMRIDFTQDGYLPEKPGLIDFRNYRFPDGGVYFHGANFGDGGVGFSNTTFGDGDVHFHGAKFGDGNVNFDGATFGDRGVHFYSAKFGDGDVDFRGATFGNGGVDFHGAKFGDGDVKFHGAKFGKGDVRFDHAEFNGSVLMSGLRGCENTKALSFRHATFTKSLVIKGNFNCVVDLVGTKTAHHVDLSGLKCHLRRAEDACLSRRIQRYGLKFFKRIKLQKIGKNILRKTSSPVFFKCRARLFQKAQDSEDAPRLRRLKELAEQNHHHQAALQFHADEMRALRWHERTILASCLDLAFSFFSNYGQSILRPFMGLFALMFVSFILFFIFGPSCWGIGDILIRVLKNSVPFIPAARPGDWYIFDIIQQLLSFILLFLIGLGLRNRFRI